MSNTYEVSGDVLPYFGLISHRYKLSYINRATPFFELLFKGVSPRLGCSGLDELAEYKHSQPEDRKPLYIHVGRHLSELDWAEAQYLFYKRGLETVISMGDNLCVWPFGNLLRSLGGFLAVREEREIEGTKFDKSIAPRIYSEYFRHVMVNEGYDVLVYPEWKEIQCNGQKRAKYGRSYSGRLLGFSPLIFRLVKSVQRITKRPVLVVPHNASRERVIEDQMFSVLAKMKEEGMTSGKIYRKDFMFICTYWLYQATGAVDFRFGKPIAVADLSTRELLEKSRLEVAKLQTLFPTHIFAYTIGDRQSVPAAGLEAEIAESIGKMEGLGLKVKCRDPGETIDRAYVQFRQIGRKVIGFRDGEFQVHRPDVISQYRDNARSIEDILAGREQNASDTIANALKCEE